MYFFVHLQLKYQAAFKMLRSNDKIFEWSFVNILSNTNYKNTALNLYKFINYLLPFELNFNNIVPCD